MSHLRLNIPQFLTLCNVSLFERGAFLFMRNALWGDFLLCKHKQDVSAQSQWVKALTPSDLHFGDSGEVRQSLL